jgi:S-adenosylmethionine:tRNA ribosyltransferase-isomerase
MRVSDFDYRLPPELIAQKPLVKRDRSRMMILHRESGEILHSHFYKLPAYLGKGDVIVVNSSKVIPAKIWGKKKEGKPIEFLFLKEKDKGKWEVLCRPAKKVKIGDKIVFSPNLEGEVVGVQPEGKRVLQFFSKNVLSQLKKKGYAPLPPYIKRRKNKTDLRDMDLERYQTVFAKKEGSIAAPTAGLHFTPELLGKIKAKGSEVCEISLDVGLATFQPVRVKAVKDHQMLEEAYEIPLETAQSLSSALKENRSITAVGTTTVRALESAYTNGEILPGKAATSLFIYPGYQFRVVDKLLTNFHLPKSTLLMLVSAFVNLDFVKKAYQEAVAHKYRFYSYGDCMLIL